MTLDSQQDNMRQMALDLAAEVHSNMLRLGDVLAAINTGRFYREWGFSTWKEYVEVEIRTSVTASYEMLNIARWAQEQKLTLTERRRVGELGRRKAYCVANLATKQTVSTWIDIAHKATIEDMRSRMYGDHPEDAPKGVTFWLQGPQRKVVERAVKLAESSMGDVNKGDYLAEICHYYWLGKAKAKRIKTAKVKRTKKTAHTPKTKKKAAKG